MKSHQSDRELVQRVLRGDIECFSALVREHAPRMLGLAVGIVGNRAEAEDVVQDALVKAYEKLGSWRGESSLSTWLYRITYTTAVSSLRGGRSEQWKGYGGSCGVGGVGATCIAEDGEEEWRLTEENIARMRRALECLCALDRTLVHLFYMEERTVREVAAICGESEGNVKTRLHRARLRLRELINASFANSGKVYF